MEAFLAWLAAGAVGPALFAVPVTAGSSRLAGLARRWFRRVRRSDGLSRIIQAAVGKDVHLTGAEFEAMRRLLEQGSAWTAIGRETVEDLASRIASCLPGRPHNEALAAGRAAAAGLLEFAARDLEPDLFQQVLLARLDRLATSQPRALDEAMVAMHADLAAQLATQDADRARFTQVMDRLGRLLDRLPPAPAGPAEVAIYLARLIGWLDTDPWPEDSRFGGRELTPSVVERKLRITDEDNGGGKDLDADELARTCTRLVVLGGPGTGKTWLARRTARLCAETALGALADGADLDEVELPLYTTCSRLTTAAPGEIIRRAVVAAAFGLLPDLGGARILDAMRMLFEERNGRVLLVADSLDEARAADDRIRQTDTLPVSWRIVLTTRPGSWNRQLSLTDRDPTRRIGTLLPLRYPEDVEPFITAWFAERHERGARLASQIRDRPALQQAATVPLMLAFYCIIGGDQPLPHRRDDLYAKVIRRMLTGRWRGSGNSDPDPNACLEILRDWAWSAAAKNQISGVGEWADEFLTSRVSPSQDDRDALDHVAVPLGLPDLDTGMILRRFVHRSVQEHLVAEHVALRMTTDEAAAELISHLWYDQDWEYTAPAALAMHPNRDDVLRNLIARITGRDEFPADLAPVDGCWEIRRFLARVAEESGEADWSSQAAALITRSRLDPLRSRQSYFRFLFPDDSLATDWPGWKRLVMDTLYGALGSDFAEGWIIGRANRFAQLVATAEDRARTQEVLLDMIASHPWTARHLARALAALAVTAEDRACAREALVNALECQSPDDHIDAVELASAVAQLEPTASDRARARHALLGVLAAGSLASEGVAVALVPLAVTVEERLETREALLGLMIERILPSTLLVLAKAIVRLGATSSDRDRAREVLLSKSLAPGDLADSLVALAVTVEDRARTVEALIDLLASYRSPESANLLVRAVIDLASAAEERARAREALLDLLTSNTGRPWYASALAEAITALDPAGEDVARAREALFGMISDQPVFASELAGALVQLAMTADDRARTRDALLCALASEELWWSAWRLVSALAQLVMTAEDRACIREALVGQLASHLGRGTAAVLAVAVAELEPTPADQLRAFETLLNAASAGHLFAQDEAGALVLLAVSEEDRTKARKVLLGLLATNPWRPVELARAVIGLDPSAEDRERARQALIGLVGRSHAMSWVIRDLLTAVTELAVSAEDRARTRDALFGLLASVEPRTEIVSMIVDAIARLAVTAADRAQVREPLLRFLIMHRAAADQFVHVADVIVELHPTAQDSVHARNTLIRLLRSERRSPTAWMLAEYVARFDPTIADLSDSGSWPVPPSRTLLAAARRNSRLTDWLEALPSLAEYAS